MDRRVAVLTANLGNFDTPVDPVKQDIDVSFHRFTDEDFPPIADLPPRFQYRIPKLFGWQMYPGYDYYIWLDGTFTLARADSARWFVDKCMGYDFAFFQHPWRKSIYEEVKHIDDYLKKGDKYITSRYKNGLHNEQYQDILEDTEYVDNNLYTSTCFVYRDSEHTRDVLRLWWLHQSRYYSCDQIPLPYVTKDSAVNVIKENQYKCKYLKIASTHK